MTATAVTDYEGWTNRATWNVSLWLNNDESNYSSMLMFAGNHGGKISGMQAMRFCRNIFGDRTPDNCKLSSVNWREIADMMEEAARS